MRGAGRAGLAALAAALLLPQVTLGHATLSRATPPVQASVERLPAEISVRFDQVVVGAPTAIRVYHADGRVVSGTTIARDRGRVLAAPIVDRTPVDDLTVRWSALSSDGHVISGVYTLGIGAPAPPPTEAVGASGLTWKDDVAKWAVFVSLALLVGVLSVRLLVLPRDVPPALERRVYLLATIGAFAAIDAGLVAFVLRGANALQLPFGDLLYADLSPFSEQTRFGTAFMVTTVGLAACAALLMVAWILDAGFLRWPVVALGAVLASGLSLSGHQATEPNSTVLTMLADWLHLVAALGWVGGLILLATCVWPLAPPARREAFLRFSRLAVVLVGVLVVAGAYLGIVRLPEVSDLWTTSYGRILLLKIAIVVAALAWGAFHHFVVRPRLVAGTAPRGIGRSLLGESGVAMAVLLAAAILVNGSPPAPETPERDAVPVGQPAR